MTEGVGCSMGERIEAWRSRLNRLNPIPVHQRPYVSSHPLGLLFSLGVAVQGGMYLLFPYIFVATASTVALSQAVLYLFNATWLVGGSLSAIGIASGHRKSEAVGMSLLGGGFSAYYAILVQAIPYGWATGLFVGFLAVACFLRVRHVSRTGYVTLEVTRNAARP